ncbi:hypothetical protein ACJMK2_011066 [Sinanodonta woodiana]|uniref:VWFA domain-containing protein n=1 Tax=Sinanodonta woodiana TaxID=1069815 RepID=A0ABD3V3U5_SINWO
MIMTVMAVIAYIIANIAGMFIFWMFEKKKEEDEEQTRVMSRRRNRLYKQPSILSMLGIEKNNNNRYFYAIEDHFTSFEEVSQACKKAGLENCGLIVGVDFTASNEWQGRKTFGGNSLHKIVGNKTSNPYQNVIRIMGCTLEPFDDDKQIPAFGFGDVQTGGESVFSFCPDDTPCNGFSEVLLKYNDIAKKIHLSGPTNFAPLIKKGIEIVKKLNKYHILLIIADGQINEEDPTIEAIVEASKYPMSIVVIGVGDGPWDTMEDFDNHLPRRTFDNFQFVNYHKVTGKARRPETTFALHAMMEIPDQYKTIKQLGYLVMKETTI